MFGFFRSKALAIESETEVEDSVSWAEKEHNAELATIAKNKKKVNAIEHADAVSRKVYDGIDDQVSDLKNFRDKLRKKALKPQDA